MFKRILLATTGLAIVGLAGFAYLAWHSAIAPITPPAASSFKAESVAAGEIIANAGYCATCHTAGGGQPLAGGYPLKTDFGIIYGPNITPDADTGIGTWSEAAFTRAMRQGVDDEGHELYPAFPFDHFTKMSDADISNLYAYIMTRPAVSNDAPENTLGFPFNIRALQAGWKFLFFKEGRFEPVAGKSDEWNRGAYLAEGVSHCGACHTPRNAVGAEIHAQAYAGTQIDNWTAPSLTATNPSPVDWSEDELFAYLRSGTSPLHGSALGPMSSVVHHGLDKLPDADIKALSVYFADIAGAKTSAADSDKATAAALAADAATLANTTDKGARLYATACATCHYNNGATNPLRPELAFATATSLPTPDNLLHVMLNGISADEGMPGVAMPKFDHFSDRDLASIAAYLRSTKTTLPAWPDLEKSVANLRALDASGEQAQ